MNKYKNIQFYSLVSLTLLLAAVLTILPLPNAIEWFKPQWMLLTLVFWVTTNPHRIGLGFAFLIGFLMDLLTGTLLGQHVFVYVLLTYILLKLHLRWRHFPVWQQTTVVFMFSLISLSLQYFMLNVTGFNPQSGWYWMPIVTSTIFWPWVYWLLRDYQQRFKLLHHLR